MNVDKQENQKVVDAYVTQDLIQSNQIIQDRECNMHQSAKLQITHLQLKEKNKEFTTL